MLRRNNSCQNKEPENFKHHRIYNYGRLDNLDMDDALNNYMKTLFFIMMVFLGYATSAQVTVKKNLVSRVTVDGNFRDTLTFNKNWDYPWYIVADADDRNMENTLSGTLTEKDTVHLHHTANCWTNHQGRHHVRYCDAYLHNDTINLVFQPELPAYASALAVSVSDLYFSSAFSAAYPGRLNNLSWIITRQQLVLDKGSYRIGDTIKGYVDIEFLETNLTENGKGEGEKYYFKGYIRTPLRKPE